MRKPVPTRIAGLMVGTLLMLVVSSAATGQYEIFLKEGKPIRGWVLGDDGSKVQVRLDTGEAGRVVTTYSYDKLGPRTIYRLMKGKIEKNDVTGQLKLGEYALENGLYMVARMHYRAALKADEAQGGKLADRLEAMRSRAAGVVLKRSKNLIAKGKELQAEKDLSLILKYLATTPEAEEARTIIAQIAQKAMGKRQERREALAKGKLEKVREKLQGLRKNYNRAHENTRKGLLVANKSVQAIRLYELAIKDFQRCIKALKKAEQDVQGDKEFLGEVNAWITVITNDKVETQLHIASAYFTRQTLTKALTQVNAILADHPKHPPALAMRGRIEVAMNDDPYDRKRGGGRRRR